MTLARSKKLNSLWTVVFLLALVPLWTASFVIAADTGRTGQQRWEEIVRAAEKEGAVVVYATNSVGDLPVIWEAFRKKFPKIKLNAVPMSTTSEPLPLQRSAGHRLE